MPTLNSVLIVLWSAGLVAWSGAGWYWFWEFYQKVSKKRNDKFTGAFMLGHLSGAIFFLYLAVVIPTGRFYDDLALLGGSVATLVGVISSGLIIYEVYQDIRRSR